MKPHTTINVAERRSSFLKSTLLRTLHVLSITTIIVSFLLLSGCAPNQGDGCWVMTKATTYDEASGEFSQEEAWIRDGKGNATSLTRTIASYGKLQTISYEYDEQGYLVHSTTESFEDETVSDTSETTYTNEFDSNGRLARQEASYDDGSWNIATREYSQDTSIIPAMISTESNPFTDGSSLPMSKTSISYAEDGFIESIETTMQDSSSFATVYNWAKSENGAPVSCEVTQLANGDVTSSMQYQIETNGSGMIARITNENGVLVKQCEYEWVSNPSEAVSASSKITSM